MTIERTEQELDRVVNWTIEGIDGGTRYAGMTYEEGVRDALEWARGVSDHAPDED